jgi:IS5 family transposase
MRRKFEKNPDLFTIPISEAEFPVHICRDEAPKILSALQHIFLNEELNRAVFSVLYKNINTKKENLDKRGRSGMGLWEILVLGVMRQGLNANYDRMHYLANYDLLMRTIMGIETESRLDKKRYGLSTIKDNLALLDEETIDEINTIVVSYGHKLLKKKEEKLIVKADTFVVETNVHFPTDLNLLWDSARKCIDISEYLSEKLNLKGWRKSKNWRKEIKTIFRVSSRVSRSGGKNKEERFKNLTVSYLNLCKKLEEKVTVLLQHETSRETNSLSEISKFIELKYFHEMLQKHWSLVNRRVINDEIINANEKLYSIFETHTEWISKGKAHKNVELGRNVLIATDQFHFIIHHQVIQKQHDSALTIELGTTLTQKYSNIDSLSLDKGFFKNESKNELKKIIPKVIIPKKGKRTKEETEEEYHPEFKRLRYAHSAVESNINQLEHNGLNRCMDKGEKNFKRYVSLSVLSYNLHRLGTCLAKVTRETACKQAA